MDATTKFFTAIQGQPRMLSPLVRATIRFDLEHGDQTDHWLLTLHNGTAEVAPANADTEANCMVHAQKPAFDQIVSGETGMIAALWRNELAVTGDMRLIATLRKLLPAPPGARDPSNRVDKERQK